MKKITQFGLFLLSFMLVSVFSMNAQVVWNFGSSDFTATSIAQGTPITYTVDGVDLVINGALALGTTSVTYDGVTYTKGLSSSGNSSPNSTTGIPGRRSMSFTAGAAGDLTVVVANPKTAAREYVVGILKEGETVVEAIETVPLAASATGAKTITIPEAGVVYIHYGGESAGKDIVFAALIWEEAVSGVPSFVTTAIGSTLEYDELEGGPSAVQSFKLSGSSLLAGEITITAPTNFEVSLNGEDFDEEVTIDAEAGNLEATTIYVRLIDGLTVGTYSGNIEILGAGVTTAKTVTCEGIVTKFATTTTATTWTAASFVDGTYKDVEAFSTDFSMRIDNISGKSVIISGSDDRINLNNTGSKVSIKLGKAFFIYVTAVSSNATSDRTITVTGTGLSATSCPAPKSDDGAVETMVYYDGTGDGIIGFESGGSGINIKKIEVIPAVSLTIATCANGSITHTVIEKTDYIAGETENVHIYPQGTEITLVPDAEEGYILASWIGVSCDANHVFTLTEAATVSASFTFATGIEDNNVSDKAVVSVKYFTTTGIEVDGTATGIVIVKTTYEDGSVDTAKKIVK